MLLFFFFFFSSRRRHTRCYRDWSSDVCSSDLGHFRAVLGAIAFDRDLIAHFQGILSPSCPPQNQRRAKFDIPIRHVAALILDVYIETSMRIHPLDLGDDSCELDRRVLVILSRKGMMRERGAGQQRQTQNGEDESRRKSSHC